jgi:hypothetical protein
MTRADSRYAIWWERVMFAGFIVFLALLSAGAFED